MAGEAVSGRYGAARHAVADGGGPQRPPISDDRSLVDRLLAGGGDDHAFDWGWGDPASGDLVTDREPLQDIPELWGSDGRSARDSGESDGPEEKHFPTPRLHGESSLDDGPAGDRDGGPGPDRFGQSRPDVLRPADPGEDDRDWSDRSQDDLGSDDWGAPAPEFEDRRPGASAFGDSRPDRALDDSRFDDLRFAGGRLDGDPLDALSTGRVLADPGPLGDSTRDQGTSERHPLHDVPMDGDHAGARPGSDPLDRDPRDRLDRSPLAPPLPDRDPLGGDRPDLPTVREPEGDRGPREPEPHDALLGRDPLNRDSLNRDSPERDWQGRDHLDPGPRSVAPAGDAMDRGPSGPGPLERRGADDDRFGGGSSRDLDRFERDPQERGANDRDPLGPEPAERKLAVADPRLRRWADRNRPSGPPSRDHADRSAAPAPFADERVDPEPHGADPLGADPLGADPLGADSLGTDRGSADRLGSNGVGPDRFGPDQLGSDKLGSDNFGPDKFGADLFGAGPDGRDRPDAGLVPRDADPYADPALTESALTGRIRIADADAPVPDHPRPEPSTGDPAGREPFDQGRESLDVTPDPTTAFTAVAPEEPAPQLEEYAVRRRAAEQEAASAEEAASSAAERASAAIAAAARAAEEAEAAAEVAAEAAAKANEAAEAEVRAIADTVARGEAPGQQDARADAPEPPTQAVPLIAPARAPGRRPPPRRPAGPPPRGARPDEPGRSGGPPPPPAPRYTPLRGGTDGEATAVLTGLEALRDPVRPRGPEPAPAEVTTAAARRRPAAEPAPAADDADDVTEHDEESEECSLVGRLTSRPVVAAVGVGAVLVLAAIVAIFTTSEPEAAPAEATPAALSEPVAQQPQPTAPAIDPDSQKAIAFLTAMRDADIPTSSSGQAETEAAAAICDQLDQGADEAQLARSVPAVLPDVTRGQASDVVDFAQQHYC
jgi:hypothetical protein